MTEETSSFVYVTHIRSPREKIFKAITRPEVTWQFWGHENVSEWDGYEACRRMRQKRGGTVRIVALTGWGQEGDRQRTTAAGFDAHLTKHVDFNRLVELVAAADPSAASTVDRQSTLG